MKKIITGLLLLLTCASSYAVDYNAIATAYVTTTISQNVVFDSTMQQGGTFNFSVLAHNGGGRAGQSDTANVKIQFYTSTNTLVSSVNSSYSANLPNPNAVCGNPCIDSAVPWSVLSTSATLSSAQASTVAYAKISMYGIDGSYWAGDYGPWYRAPTFQLNGGGNLAYNPEFGPYNNITAQGWTSSPGFGACQGAWGGSNACIVNDKGVPGTSTVGLVANANGGGPSATGGTTSGQAGGYNSTMGTTNAGAGTGLAPASPTVTSTTTTNSTKITIVGSQQQVTTTPVTTKTYSDGTSTSTNGTATTTVKSNSAFTGVHFSASQTADTQWDVGACMYSNTCNIYSTAPGITYNTGSPTYISSTQYITFVPNTDIDSATNPWRMILVNANGTFTDLGSCMVAVQGTDSNGYIYLFVTNDNWNGTLLSGNIGLSGQGMSFTGTQNPTASQTETLAGGMSSTPLAAGQTGGNAAGPTVVSTSTSNTVTDSYSSSSANTTNQYTNGNYNYSFTGTVTTTTDTQVTTPVTTTTYSDGTSTTSSGTSTTNQIVTTSYSITPGQSLTPADRNPFRGTLVNSITISEPLGSASNKIQATQKGTGNNIEMSVTGVSNNVSANQGFTVNSLGTPSESTTVSNNNFAAVNVSGNNNNVTSQQTGLMNSVILGVTGNYNTATTTQSGNNNQSYFSINGNNNTATASQTGNGNLSAITLTGAGNNITVGQTGNNNGALISATNAGGATTVNLLQQAVTQGQTFVVQQTCTNGAGCSVSVQQNR